jgi:hypothetical protein
MAKKQEDFQVMDTFQRPRWKHGTRIFGFIVMAVLNVSLVMSDVERIGKHHELSLIQEVITYLALIVIDATLLLPIVFEVDKVIVQDSRLILKTLFWTAKPPWSDLISFSNPKMLKFGILKTKFLKTKKIFYLINRRDIRGYDRLAQILSERINATVTTPKA